MAKELANCWSGWESRLAIRNSLLSKVARQFNAASSLAWPWLVRRWGSKVKNERGP